MSTEREGAMSEQSRAEIERWTQILGKCQNGRERLINYLGSLTLGRDFLEPVDAYLERRGLTGFDTWAARIINGEGV